ncbi:hypothetical protein BC830DRAFT_1135603 [Chytriomyces sp. MP71]|nr:hypothetical protein BC830DRAFT_1135603 [Chytriomyces sp. MP71]
MLRRFLPSWSTRLPPRSFEHLKSVSKRSMSDESAIKASQDSWKFRGNNRPPFAIAPGPGQESVWDYPRPPAIVPDPRAVTVKALGKETPIVNGSLNAIRICETAAPPTWYLPKSDVDTTKLVRVADQSSFCEWKGAATYWALTEAPGKAVAWSYESPRKEFQAIAGHICFYPSRVECYVQGKETTERVRPQPSEFYGGWVTNEIVGPFKGEAGTSHW